MSLFADDTKKNCEFLRFSLNYIYKWLKTRKIDLNPNKCKAIIIKKNKLLDPIDQLINNTKIPTV